MIDRRRLLGAAAAAPFVLRSSQGHAQGAFVPTREVEFVIPFAPGGGADLLARVIHRIITEERLVPVPMALNNRPGGGGAVGLGYVTARKLGDPHTIIVVNGTTQITPILNPQARTLTEVRPSMNVMLDDFLLFVRADAPWQTAQEMVTAARGRPPRSIAFATGGTTDVMAIAVFSRTTGVEFNAINLNSGGEALTQLLGGHVQACMGNPLEFRGHLESRAVRALGVFRDTRFDQLPDVPTMKEQGINAPNFQMWRGMAVPRGTPDAAAVYWEGVFKRVVATRAFRLYLRENLASEAPLVGAEFERFLQEQERFYRELLGRPA